VGATVRSEWSAQRLRALRTRAEETKATEPANPRRRRASAAILTLSGIHAMPFSLEVGGIKRLIFALAFHRAINASSTLS